ncbi:MAG: elongation factor P [Deltaproteobacteria bacterium]|nr:elongation factor P [Deltaproteobacteria bacterium]
MIISATQLRAGMVLMHKDELHRVMNVTHVTPGNWRGMVQTKMRSMRSGNSTEHRFRSEDKVERVTLEQHEMEFLYTDGDQFHFMNTETFEQIGLSSDDLGEAQKFLLPNSKVNVEFHDSKPIGVSLPKSVDLTVTETAPGLRGATVTNALKPATLETGLVVQVPNFIDVGDVIRIDTETAAYVSRAKGD